MTQHHTDTATQARALIEAQIELHLQRVTLLIAILDGQDGDCDREDDDPGGDPLDEWGEAPTHTGEAMLRAVPVYGINQARGPINWRAAMDARQQEAAR